MVTIQDIVSIPLYNIQEEVEFAYTSAFAKSRYTNTQNTWQSNRSAFRKFTDLFPGDLAKNVVRRYLASKEIELIDYDKIRTDNFRSNDLFDLKFGNKIIEVKSSVEKYDANSSNLVSNRRIIIYANRPLSDYIIQVFYAYKDFPCKSFFTDMEKMNESQFKQKYKILNERDFVDLFINCSPNALIMGFVTKADAQGKLNEVFTYRNANDSNDNKRNYVNFFIKDSKKIADLVIQLNS